MQWLSVIGVRLKRLERFTPAAWNFMFIVVFVVVVVAAGARAAGL